MASILRVNTLTDASSNNSIAMSTINQGTAKAWANLKGTDTFGLRDNFNVGSATDNGTGDYSLTWASSMSDVNYCILQSYEVSAESNTRSTHQLDSYSYATTGYRILTSLSTNQSASDFTYVWTAIQGDLA